MQHLIQLEAARARVTIAPQFGGRIAQIEALHEGAWVRLLHESEDIPLERRDPMSWGSFVMAPWPNRIARGRFVWRGQTYELPPNLGPHAGHGVGFDRPWRVEAATASVCTLSLKFDARWRFGGRVTQRIEMLDDGVAQTVEVHATDAAFPAGAGWHPWFRRDLGGAKHVHALVDADQRYELADMLPTGRLLPVEGGYDLRAYPSLGERRLDDCYFAHRGSLRIRWGDLELRMESSDNVEHAVVFTPQHAVCLELQTCAIDAFNLYDRGFGGTGVQVVEPGRPLVARTVWRWATVDS
jgi:aldose 1-epimerase